MISIARSKLIRSLDRKKSREQQNLFVVEGVKMVRELLDAGESSAHRVVEIFATEDWIRTNGDILPVGLELTGVSEKELRKVSQLVTPQQVLALVRIPEQEWLPASLAGETVIGLEAIRDPGNLGTILRTADWFGIRHILCTPDSVDLYNPKVVQASMGAITRTRVYYTDLLEVIKEPALLEKPIYGTFLGGENIYETEMGQNPLILFGNESTGLSGKYDTCLKGRLSIPSFAGETGTKGGQGGPESLNLASAVAVVCSEILRRK